MKEGGKIIKAIQVCHKLIPDIMEREVEGLQEAILEYAPETSQIITYDQTDTLNLKDISMSVIPAWQWLLTKKPPILNNIIEIDWKRLKP